MTLLKKQKKTKQHPPPSFFGVGGEGDIEDNSGFEGLLSKSQATNTCTVIRRVQWVKRKDKLGYA